MKISIKSFIVIAIVFLFLGSLITLFITEKGFAKQPKKISSISTIDTTKYEEVRYVNAKHFTSSGLYNLHCKQCHGNYGTGDGVLARYNSKICPHDLSKVTKTDQDVYFIILKGGDYMPDATRPVSDHVLTDDNIWMVVYYIKKFKE